MWPELLLSLTVCGDVESKETNVHRCGSSVPAAGYRGTRVSRRCSYFAICSSLDFQRKKGFGLGGGGIRVFTGMIAHTCRPSIWEAKAGRLSAWASYCFTE